MQKLILVFIFILIFAAILIAIRSVISKKSSKALSSTLFIAALVSVDQLIKYLIVTNFEECRGAIRSYFTFKIGNFRIFSLTHIRNDGAGWSILGGKTVFLSAFTAVVIIGIIIYMIIRREKIKKAELISLSLIIAGGLGNLIDRLRMLIEGTDRFPGVIDYVKLDFIDYPVFNFADCCVVIGAIIFCIIMVVDEINEEKRKKAQKRLLAAALSEENKENGSDEPL